jgi:hypothetical protein
VRRKPRHLRQVGKLEFGLDVALPRLALEVVPARRAGLILADRSL